MTSDIGMISVPIVILMLIIQPDILTYSIWLAMAFGFRCVVFAVFLLGRQIRFSALLGVFKKQKIHSLAIKKIIFGGTAMIAALFFTAALAIIVHTSIKLRLWSLRNQFLFIIMLMMMKP